MKRYISFLLPLLIFSLLAGCGRGGSSLGTAKPAISPDSGTYENSVTVTMTSETPGAEIWYTTDLSLPAENHGTRYLAPFVISTSQTIKAVAIDGDRNPSSVASAVYVITGTAQKAELPSLTLKEVALSVPLLSGVVYPDGSTAEDLLFTTLYGQGQVGSGTFADADQGQLAFLELPTGDHTPVLVAYLSSADIAAGAASITIEKAAAGFLMLNPLIFGYSATDRAAVLAEATTDSDYPALKNAILNAIEEEPVNILNGAVFAEIYSLATRILLNVTAEPQFAKTFADVGVVVPVLGESTGPFLGDLPGPEVIFANPTMAFYGVDVDSGADLLVLPGREWNKGAAKVDDPVSLPYDLGTGAHSVKISKGSGTSGDVASYLGAVANSTKLTQLILDVLSWCPVQNEGIALGVEDGYYEGDTQLVTVMGLFSNLENASPQVLFDSTLTWLETPANWAAVTKYLYKGASDKAAASRFLKNAKRAIANGGDALAILSKNNARSKTEPFSWDLINGLSPLSFCAEQVNGTLLEGGCTNLPPTPSVLINPFATNVGEAIFFNASGSSDDKTPPSELMVRWDFEADGVFDTSWSTTKTTTHVYPNVGDYHIFVEVKDGEGVVSRLLLNVYANPLGAQGMARHIVAFRDNLPWSTAALEMVMSELGYAEGSGDLEYEILPSTEMESVVMVPGRDMVVIVNDQNQNFYNNLAASLPRFERFIESGGVVFWGGCDLGWGGGGSMAEAGITTLPGGVTFAHVDEATNYNVAPDTYLMDGVAEVMTGISASHESFGNLPEDAMVYLTDPSGRPTLVEYNPYGSDGGSVMLTGNTLEFYAGSGHPLEGINQRIYRYILGQNGFILAKAPAMPLLLPKGSSSAR